MKIDGKAIASEIKENLKVKTALLQRSVVAHLAVILIGNDPSSLTYVRQKQKIAEELGVKLSIAHFSSTIHKDELTRLTNEYNADKSIHGIIIQRPVPISIEKVELDKLVLPKKDIDGFHPNSPYTPPVSAAIIKILEYVFQQSQIPNTFLHWLKSKKIIIIGRGETGGKPIADSFQKIHVSATIAHSHTAHLDKAIKSSDIVISCVGKPNIVRAYWLTKKSIVIGVGLYEEDGKLKTDYNQQHIAKVAAFYTPVPGGVGPVNVACLFENLMRAVALTLRRTS